MHLKDKELGPADFEEAEKEFPDNPDFHNLRGHVYVINNRQFEALADYTKAHQLAPKHLVTYIRKCCAMYKINRERYELLDQITKLQYPKDVHNLDCYECYFLIAEILAETERYDEASAVYQCAIKQLPKIALLHSSYAKLIFKWKDDLEEAINLAQKAIEIDDTCDEAYSNLAQFEYANGNSDRALELFDKAISCSIFPEPIFTLCKLKTWIGAENKMCKMLGYDRSPLLPKF